MRVGVLALALILALRSAADAERLERFEASGFLGFGYFSDNSELGNSWAPEQVPSSAPLVGGRVGWIAREWRRAQLALEAELSMATAFTGGESGRMSYFAPVFGWRAHAAFRLLDWPKLRPHLVVGAGGETIASSSPFMSKETDPVLYWGLGAVMPLSKRWGVRLDVRHGIMPGRSDATSTVEVQMGLVTTFGVPRVRTVPPPEVVVEPAPPAVVPVDDTDSDADGLPDRLDRCAKEPETINGLDDGDGCPDVAPPVSDGDLDDDTIEDARDKCPDAAEIKNGFEDADGCPDTVPAELTQALAAKLAWDPRSAKITKPTRTALEPVAALLGAKPDLRIAITGRAEKAGGEDLAKRRAEAVKWYLVDQGIAADRITTQAAGVGRPVVELTLATQ